MAGESVSFLGGWWAWLLGRGRPGRGQKPAAELPPPPFPEVRPMARVAPPPRVVPPSTDSTALADMLGRVDLALAEVVPSADAAAVRERTLGALGNLQQIPALRSFARDFLRILNQTDVDVADVTEVIAKDSALCMRILRMANSVLVSSERRIEDLDTAVQMLGLARVRKAAQTIFMLRDGNRVADGFDWRHLWMHAIATAMIAEELERRLRGEEPASLHVAALLHDVGKMVLATVAPDEYRAILIATWQERGRLEELERGRLGVDHREAGRRFAQQSGMPEMAVQAIAHHDQPEQAESCRFEVAVVSLANYLSKAHGLGFSGARLEAVDGDFADLPAWRVIGEELGYRPDAEAVETEMAEFVGGVRADLREMRNDS